MKVWHPRSFCTAEALSGGRWKKEKQQVMVTKRARSSAIRQARLAVEVAIQLDGRLAQHKGVLWQRDQLDAMETFGG